MFVQDVFGSCDPFCEVSFMSQTAKTSVKKGCYDPCWEESIAFDILDDTQFCGSVEVRVYDWDALSKNDLIGTVIIDFDEIITLLRDGNEKCYAIYDKDRNACIGINTLGSVLCMRMSIVQPTSEIFAKASRCKLMDLSDPIAFPYTLRLIVHGASHLPKKVCSDNARWLLINFLFICKP